jgi:hypothetical protein
VAGGELVVAEVPGLASVKAGQDIFRVTDCDGLAPGLQGLGRQFQTTGEFVDYLSGGLAAASLKE